MRLRPFIKVFGPILWGSLTPTHMSFRRSYSQQVCREIYITIFCTAHIVSLLLASPRFQRTLISLGLQYLWLFLELHSTFWLPIIYNTLFLVHNYLLDLEQT
ncbi:unnamed protein product [Musa acuminata subsp. malaccensis]|uniref:Uncharacterized protein n=1 Tax=Musa acuminata subsp. malaccensis TaxID=214687 RepID=A0A804HMB3_MUSAM|nr:unnamed protein product [Musa acuminata subsp. malaccensis]